MPTQTLWRNSTGKVLIDSRGRLILCEECPCDTGDKVLLWDADYTYPEAFGLDRAKESYFNAGITAHLSTEWTGVLSDYKLIIFAAPTSDPSWWGEITGGTWSGRLHLCGEWFIGGGTPAMNTYINSKTALHGMTLNDFGLFPGSGGCYPDIPFDGDKGILTAHQLCDGVTDFYYAASSIVTGGTDVIMDENWSGAMMQQKKVGLIDWVVAGDCNHVISLCSLHPLLNENFLRRLLEAPIP